MDLVSSIQMAGKFAHTLENIEDPDELAHYELSLQEFYYLTKWTSSQDFSTYSKPCLKKPLKIDKTKISMTNGSLTKVESYAECSPLD